MQLRKGRARTEVTLKAERFGDHPVIYIFNENAHIGAVALADYDAAHGTASVSVITRAGHKEDLIARGAAYRVSKALQKPVCVLAGIHIDKAGPDEIRLLRRNAALVVTAFLKASAGGPS